MILTIILICIAAIINAAMDMDMNMFVQSIFSKFKNQNFWNPVLSYKNKWKDGISGGKPRFFGSTTFLVFLTDGWHLLKTALLCIFFFLLSKPIIVFELHIPRIATFFIIYICWGIVFELAKKRFTLK